METWREELAEIRAIMAENAKEMAETRRGFAEIRAIMADGAKESEKKFAEMREQREKARRDFEETNKQEKERAARVDKAIEKMSEEIRQANEYSKSRDKSIEKMSEEVRRLNNTVNGEKSEKEWTEIKEKQRENAKLFDRVEMSIEKMSQEVRRLNNTVNGVSKSNGMMAEEFFYNSLKSTKTFGGVHFDKVKKNLYGNASKEGENLEGEYDITMINGDSLCIVETKYRVRPDDVSDIVKRRLVKFRELLPKYAGYKIYLGIGGMSFENDKMIEKKAKDFGVGILKLNGDVVEIYDKNLKVY